MILEQGRSKWWDFTLWGEHDAKSIKELLSKIAKRWAFQQEAAPSTGQLHYQGKMELFERQRGESVVRSFAECGFGYVHLERSYDIGNFDYVTKSQTRVAGPWKWDDIVIPDWLADEQPNWYPWQAEVLSWKKDSRSVHLIIDTIGNTGKSYLSNWLAVRGKAVKIPVLKSHKDVMRAICDRPTKEIYFLDVPRAEKLNDEMMAAIESIKDGHAFDDRYRFTETWFDPPVVIIFTNEAVNAEALSKDRWKRYRITQDRKLAKF